MRWTLVSYGMIFRRRVVMIAGFRGCFPLDMEPCPGSSYFDKYATCLAPVTRLLGLSVCFTALGITQYLAGDRFAKKRLTTNERGHLSCFFRTSAFLAHHPSVICTFSCEQICLIGHFRPLIICELRVMSVGRPRPFSSFFFFALLARPGIIKNPAAMENERG